MDTDPAGTLDFIWFKGDRIEVISSERKGEKPDPNDATIYGSDHFALVTEFEIHA